MNLPFAPLAAAALGVVVAAGVALMPAPMLEGLVSDSGIASVVSAAEPPLGMTARAAIALGTGGVVAVFAWLALFILFGTRGLTIGSVKAAAPEAAKPVIRRADAHPDANPRAPLLATRDLGEPFHRDPVPEPAQPAVEPLFAPPPQPEPVAVRHAVPEEQPLPEDLGQPLSAFDPGAIPEAPRPAPDHLAPLRRRPAVFDDSERFEIFELTPIRRAPPPRPAPAPVPAPRPREEAMARPETDATIHALLDRLEKGVVRRGLASGTEPQKPRDTERGLEEALVTLRNLARRA